MDYLENMMTYDELVKSAQSVEFNDEMARKLYEEIRQSNKQFDEESRARVVTAEVLAIRCTI